MARRRRDHAHDLIERPRDTFDIAMDPLRDLRPLDPIPMLRRQEVLDLGDRRFFHPERELAPAASRTRNDRRLVARSVVDYPGASWRRPERFNVAGQVAICVRRKTRREVLFAKKRGGGGNRKPRWNEWSDVKCR